MSLKKAFSRVWGCRVISRKTQKGQNRGKMGEGAEQKKYPAPIKKDPLPQRTGDLIDRFCPLMARPMGSFPI